MSEEFVIVAWIPPTIFSRGSTDVGGVSWCCPTAQFPAACTALGTPGHCWRYTAQTGMGIGHAGMIVASKALAQAGLMLMTSENLLAEAESEFKRRTRGGPYKCALPVGVKPAFNQFRKTS